jgi:hypothetical protein
MADRIRAWTRGADPAATRYFNTEDQLDRLAAAV